MVIISLLALAVLDYGFVKRFLHPGGRYFALHAAANAATAVAAWPDVYRAIRDPTAAFGGPSTTMVSLGLSPPLMSLLMDYSGC